MSEESVVTGWSRPHPGPALAPCFPSVLLQLEEADTGRDLEQHFAMFSLALKSDRTNLIERVGRTFSIMLLVASLGIYIHKWKYSHRKHSNDTLHKI